MQLDLIIEGNYGETSIKRTPIKRKPVLSLSYGKGIITNKLKLVVKADELELWKALLTTWNFITVQRHPLISGHLGRFRGCPRQ